jgi:predicted amidohydrolase YtcJ
MQSSRRSIFTNAEIVTLSATAPGVEAVCAAEGRILHDVRVRMTISGGRIVRQC